MAKKQSQRAQQSDNDTPEAVRLDKWLWAARFYKTRSIAREMLQSGKVQYNEQRAKPGRAVEIGAKITLQQGDEVKTVIIVAISGHRRGAPEAQALYDETAESLVQREKNAEARKNKTLFAPHPIRKPDKKQRRQIIQFKNTE